MYCLQRWTTYLSECSPDPVCNSYPRLFASRWEDLLDGRLRDAKPFQQEEVQRQVLVCSLSHIRDNGGEPPPRFNFLKFCLETRNLGKPSYLHLYVDSVGKAGLDENVH